jgi:hypothetical protein
LCNVIVSTILQSLLLPSSYPSYYNNYFNIPKEYTTDNPIAKLSVRADKAVLYKFANLANLLGFKSAEITELRDYLQLTAKQNLEVSKLLLVTNSPSIEEKKDTGSYI